MAKKPAATEVKKPAVKKAAPVEKKAAAPVETKGAAPAKPHSAKPGTNPFVTQHPGKPGRSGSGMNMMLRRDPR